MLGRALDITMSANGMATHFSGVDPLRFLWPSLWKQAAFFHIIQETRERLAVVGRAPDIIVPANGISAHFCRAVSLKFLQSWLPATTDSFFFAVFGRAFDVSMSANEIPTRFVGQFHFDFAIFAARCNRQLLPPLACARNEWRSQQPAAEHKNPGSSPDVPGSPPDVHYVMHTVDLPSFRSLCHIEVAAACPAIIETGIPPADAAEGFASDHSSLSIFWSPMVRTLHGVSMAPTVLRR